MKYLVAFSLIFGAFTLSVQKALAVCPICTITVGAGLGLSRWLGIDDSISGLWIGGFAVSVIIWVISRLQKKNIKFKRVNILTVIGTYSLIFIPLYFLNIIGNPMNTICSCGLDKLTIGIIVGSAAFWFGANWYFYLKKKNGGHAHFPFQKVVMPVIPLIILSVIFYFLT